MSKQDRQGVRTPADLEQKYNFGQAFSDQKAALERHGEQLSRLNDAQTMFVNETSTNFAGLTKRMTASEKDIDALDERANALGKRLAYAEYTNAQQERSIASLGSGLTNSEQAASALTERMSAAEQSISTLESRMTAAEAVVSAMEATIADLTERIIALESGD